MGIAKAYRQWLLEGGKLTKQNGGDAVPVRLEMVLSEQEKGLIGSKTVTMTTLEQAREILQELCGAGRMERKACDMVLRYLIRIQNDINQSIVQESRFAPDANFAEMKELAAPIINRGCRTGDGWLVAAEAADLIERGYENILIVHPFGCLVSHVCERGILKKLHERYPNVNIQTVEYDYDSANTLRESRIMLGISGRRS